MWTAYLNSTHFSRKTSQQLQPSETVLCVVLLHSAGYLVWKLPLAKHQGGFGLCIIVARGRATDEHSGATVPAQ